MSHRALTALIVLQTVLVSLLLLDRVIPTAHASGPMACQVTNWPDSITGTGFAAIKVKLEDPSKPLPVVMKDWDTSDLVQIQVRDWATYDEVKVGVVNWDTNDRVKIEQ